MDHVQLCEQVITTALLLDVTTKDALTEIKRLVAGSHKMPAPSTAQIRAAYLTLIDRGIITPNKQFDSLLRKRDVRTQSGVAIITVLTKPYPCPGKCTYCPTEVRMPKSYIETEPAAQRALAHSFDPYNQVAARLTTLTTNGHDVDKIELIVKGGTWSAYRWDYQLWFIRRCFDACNDFRADHEHATSNDQIKTLASGSFQYVDTPEMKTHDAIAAFTATELAYLRAAQISNEDAHCRIIGMTLETRPDWIRPHTIWQLRELGCTRIELGLQHTDNAILDLVKRGHTLEDTMEALRLLRHAGFKVDVHTMPQLPGATPEKDFEMYEIIFRDKRLRPDMIKIYPCVVTPTAEIANWFAAGTYTPYPLEKLIELLVRVKSELIPYYCRISRLIRDIPGNEIIAGNTITNLRETIQRIIATRGLHCNCLRCREIGHSSKHAPELLEQFSSAQLFIDEYSASDGTEFFLSIEDAARKSVFAFLRLYIPDETEDAATAKIHELLPETKGTAFVRELHTYGFIVPLASGAHDEQQHRGLGKKLMLEAEKIAHAQGRSRVTVISGIGVRGYYRKLGYSREGTYMVKSV